MDTRSTDADAGPGVSLVDRVLAGDPRGVARAMSLVEDETEEGIALLRALFLRAGRARLVGITGPPGAGKSTLVDRLTGEIRKEGKRVGVLAIDPTSPFSGGAVLGDRVRMGHHFADSMATRGQLGGLARATSDLAQILDASGADVILIETVGVGQGEVDIVRTADVCVVVLAPGSGDEVQALKAGIMEIADVFVVNQADRQGADHLVQAIAANQSLRVAGPTEWRPPILKTVATTGDGVSDVWGAIGRFVEHQSQAFGQRRRTRQAHRLRELLSHRFLQDLEGVLLPGELDRMIDRIAAREIDPYSTADELLERWVKGHAGKGTQGAFRVSDAPHVK